MVAPLELEADFEDRDWNVFAIDLGRWKPDLHPRDSKGRFRDKWGLSPKAMQAVDRLLAAFKPPPLRSDAHAASLLKGSKGPKRTPKQVTALRAFLTREGNENIQSTLRAGDQDTPAIRELKGMVRPLEHDLILSRVVGPDAFGLPGEQIDGVEEWSGKKILDHGFQPMNAGNPYQIAGPHVEMRVLVPRGTPAIVVGDDAGPDEARTVILAPDTPLQLGTIQKDGRGGWYAMATVAPSQGTGTPRGLGGRKLGAREMAPAEEATPEAFERRGLNPEADGGFGPQEQPERFGPAAGGGTGERTLPQQQGQQVQSIPNPASSGTGTSAQQIQESGGEIPSGAGGQGAPTPRKKIERSPDRQVEPEEVGRARAEKRAAAAADRETRESERRRVAAEKVAAQREARLRELEARADAKDQRATETLAKANDAQARTIEQQSSLIDRLMALDAERAALPSSEGGTNPAGMTRAQKKAMVRRAERIGDQKGEENDRIRRVAQQIRESGEDLEAPPAPAKAAKAAKKATKAAAPEAPAPEAPQGAPSLRRLLPEEYDPRDVDLSREQADLDKGVPPAQVSQDLRDRATRMERNIQAQRRAADPNNQREQERLDRSERQVQGLRDTAQQLDDTMAAPSPGTGAEAIDADYVAGLTDAERRQLANYRADNISDLQPIQAKDLQKLNTEKEEIYWARRQAGFSHPRAMRGLATTPSPRTGRKRIAPTKRVNRVGTEIRGADLQELRPGDVVDVPARNGRGTQRKTVRVVDGDNVVFTDGTTHSPEGGELRVREQGNLPLSPTAAARRKKASDRAAAGMGLNEAIEAFQRGEITPDQAIANVRNKLADLRKLQLGLQRTPTEGEGAPAAPVPKGLMDDLDRSIKGLEKFILEARGSRRETASKRAEKSAIKKAARDILSPDEVSELEDIQAARTAKKATKGITKKATPRAAAEAVPEGAPDAERVNAVRQAKLTSDINRVAQENGVRIPSTIGRREDRRQFLENALKAKPGESKADYDARMEELKAPKPRGRGRPPKALTPAPEAPAAEAPAKKAPTKRGITKAAPVKASTIDKATPAQSPVEPAPKPVKVTRAAKKAAAAESVETPKFTARNSKEYRPTKLVKTARLVDTKEDGSPLGPNDETVIEPEWGGEQRFKGPFMEVLGPDGKRAYGSALDEWNENNERVPDTENGWVKVTPVTAYQHKGEPRRVETVLKDGTKETSNVANDGDWVVRQPNGEVQVIKDSEFRSRYQTDAPQSVGTHARFVKKATAAKAPAAKKARPTVTRGAKKDAPEAPPRPAPDRRRRQINAEDAYDQAIARGDADEALRLWREDEIDGGNTPSAQMVRSRKAMIQRQIKRTQAKAAPAPAKKTIRAAKKAAPEAPAARPIIKRAKAAAVGSPEGKKIVKDYVSGSTIEETAAKNGVTPAVARRALREHGVSIRSRGGARPKRATPEATPKMRPQGIVKKAPAKAPAKKAATTAKKAAPEAPTKKATRAAKKVAPEAPVKATRAKKAAPEAAPAKRAVTRAPSKKAAPEFKRERLEAMGPRARKQVDALQGPGQEEYFRRLQAGESHTAALRHAEVADSQVKNRLALERQARYTPESVENNTPSERRAIAKYASDHEDELNAREAAQVRKLRDTSKEAYWQRRRDGGDHRESIQGLDSIGPEKKATTKAATKAVKEAAPTKVAKEAPPAKTPAKRAARPVTVRRAEASATPGNARDKRRFEGAEDKATIKARADELAASGSTSAAAWRTALDEHDFRQRQVGAPETPTKKVAAKRATTAEPRLTAAEKRDLDQIAEYGFHNSRIRRGTNAAANKRLDRLIELGYVEQSNAGTGEVPAYRITDAGRVRAGQTLRPETPAAKKVAEAAPEAPTAKATRAARSQAAEPVVSAPSTTNTQPEKITDVEKMTQAKRDRLLKRVREASSQAEAERILDESVNRTVMQDIAQNNPGLKIDHTQTIAGLRRDLAKAMRRTPTFRPLRGEQPRKRALKSGTPSADAAVRAVMNNLSPEARKSVLDSMTPDERRSVEDAIGRQEERLSARKAARLAKKATPEVEAPAPAKKARAARKAAPEAAPEAEAPAATKRVQVKRGGKAITAQEARRESALDAIRANEIEGSEAGGYNNIIRNVQSGDWTPARARMEAKGSEKYWRQQARDARGFGRATPAERKRIEDKHNATADRYARLADAISESQSKDAIDKRRFEERPVAAKKAARKARTPRPVLTEEQHAVEDRATREYMQPFLDQAGVDFDGLNDTDRLGVLTVGDQLRTGRISRAEAVRRLRAGQRRDSRLGDISDALSAPRTKATKKAAKAAKVATPEAPAKKTAAERREERDTAKMRRDMEVLSRGGYRNEGEAAPAKKAAAPEAPPAKAARPERPVTVKRQGAKKVAKKAVRAPEVTVKAPRVRKAAAKAGAYENPDWTPKQREAAADIRGTLARLTGRTDLPKSDRLVGNPDAGMPFTSLHDAFRNGGYVFLADIRDALGEKYSRPDVDQVLRDFVRHDPSIRGIPVSARAGLAQRDHDSRLYLLPGAEDTRIDLLQVVDPETRLPAKKAAPRAAAGPALKYRAPENLRKEEGDLTPDEIAQINDLTPDSAERYWRARGRGAGHETAWRSVPKGESIEELRRPSQPPGETGVRPQGTGNIEELRRPSAQFERRNITRPGGRQRLTEEEKDQVIADARANPNDPDLVREAAEIQMARDATNRAAAKAAPKKPGKKVAERVAKTRDRRSEQYARSIENLLPQMESRDERDSSLARHAIEDLRKGEPATSVKERLAHRADFHRDSAEAIGRQRDLDRLDRQHIDEHLRLAELYDEAAGNAKKKVARVKGEHARGAKIPVIDLEDGDVAVLDGKRGIYRSPKPRTTFIQFPDGSQEKVQKTKLAGMVREKRLQLLGGEHRPETVATPARATKKVSLKRAPASAAAATPGNTADRRRLDGIGDKDAVKARADELVRDDGKTSPAAWRQALDEAEAGPAKKAAPRATKKTVAKKAPAVKNTAAKAPAKKAAAKKAPAKKATRKMQPFGVIRREGPGEQVQPEADSPARIIRDLDNGQITRAEARDRIRAQRERIRNAESSIEEPEATSRRSLRERAGERITAARERLTERRQRQQASRAERRQERARIGEGEGPDLRTEARDRGINTRDSAIREALDAQDTPNAYRALRKLDSQISRDRQEANLLDYGTREAPEEQPRDYTGGLSARSRRLRRRANQRAELLHLVFERGHRHEATPRMRPMGEVVPMGQRRAKKAGRAAGLPRGERPVTVLRKGAKKAAAPEAPEAPAPAKATRAAKKVAPQITEPPGSARGEIQELNGDEIRAMGREAGVGDLEGDTPDELFADLDRKVRAQRRLAGAKKAAATRAAKRAEAAKAAPAPAKAAKAAAPTKVAKVAKRHHVSETERITALRDSAESGTTRVRRLGGGEDGGNVNDVALVRDANGKQLIRKEMRQDAHLDPERQADAENLNARLAEGMGVDAPATYQSAPDTVFQERIEGRLASKVDKERLQKLLDSPEGRRIHLMDLITGNPDRHDGNMMVGKDGKLYAIDHGMSFADGFTDRGPDGDIRPVPPSAHDPFRRSLKATTGTYTRGGAARDDYQWADEVPFTRAEVMQARRQLVKMRPEFTRAGRQQWYKDSLERADALLKRAQANPRAARKVAKVAPERPVIKRAATKAAPEAARPDVRELAKDLGFTKADDGLLEDVQDLLDGKHREQIGDMKPGVKPTPRRVAKYLRDSANSAGSPTHRAIIRRQVGEDRRPGESDARFKARRKQELAEADALSARGKARLELADRIEKIRTPRVAKKVAPEAPSINRDFEEEDTVSVEGRRIPGVISEVLPNGKVRVDFTRRLNRTDTREDSIPIDREKLTLVRKGNKIKDQADLFMGGMDIGEAMKEATRRDRLAKKAAKAAPTPRMRPMAAEKSPGTAEGRLTAVRLRPGDRIMVEKRSDGSYVSTRRKTGAIPVEITKNERVATSGGSVYRARQSRQRILGRDADGNEIRIDSSPSQTWQLAKATPEAPAAAKKAPKKVAPAKVVARKSARATAPERNSKEWADKVDLGERRGLRPSEARAFADSDHKTVTGWRRENPEAEAPAPAKAARVAKKAAPAKAARPKAVSAMTDDEVMDEARGIEGPGESRREKAIRARAGLIERRREREAKKTAAPAAAKKAAPAKKASPSIREMQAETEAKNAAAREESLRTRDGIPPSDGRPDITDVATRLSKDDYHRWQLGSSKGRKREYAPDVARTTGGWIDNRHAGAELMNPKDGKGDYRWRIFDERTGETIEEGKTGNALQAYQIADRIFSSQRGGGMARSRGKSSRFEARRTERPKDRSRGDIGKGPFYDHSVVEIDQDGNETTRVRTSSMDRAEAQAADLNRKEELAQRAVPGNTGPAKKAAPGAPAAKAMPAKKAAPRVDTLRKELLAADTPEKRREILDSHDEGTSLTRWRALAKGMGVTEYPYTRAQAKEAIERAVADGRTGSPRKSLADDLRAANVDMSPKKGRWDHHGTEIETASRITPDDPEALRTRAAKFEHDAKIYRDLAGMVEANRSDQPDRVAALRKGADSYDGAAKVFRRRADAIDKARATAPGRKPESERHAPEVVPSKPETPEPAKTTGATTRGRTKFSPSQVDMLRRLESGDLSQDDVDGLSTSEKRDLNRLVNHGLAQRTTGSVNGKRQFRTHISDEGRKELAKVDAPERPRKATKATPAKAIEAERAAPAPPTPAPRREVPNKTKAEYDRAKREDQYLDAIRRGDVDEAARLWREDYEQQYGNPPSASLERMRRRGIAAQIQKDNDTGPAPTKAIPARPMTGKQREAFDSVRTSSESLRRESSREDGWVNDADVPASRTILSNLVRRGDLEEREVVGPSGKPIRQYRPAGTPTPSGDTISAAPAKKAARPTITRAAKAASAKAAPEGLQERLDRYVKEHPDAGLGKVPGQYKRGLITDDEAEGLMREADLKRNRGQIKQPSGPVVRHHDERRSPFRGGSWNPQPRAKEDEPLLIPNGGADQGTFHMDSQLGQLWEDLYQDDRVPNSTINKLTRIGDSLGRRGSDTTINDVVPDLRRLADDAPDTGVADRIRKVADELDVPRKPVPDLPDDTPKPLRDFIEKLNENGTARRTGRFHHYNVEEGNSLVDRVAKLYRDISEGNGDKERNIDALGKILQSYHESTDGAYPLKRLNTDAEERELTKWRREVRRRGASADAGVPGPAKAPVRAAQDLSPSADADRVTTARDRLAGRQKTDRITRARGAAQLAALIQNTIDNHQGGDNDPSFRRAIDQDLKGAIASEGPRDELAKGGEAFKAAMKGAPRSRDGIRERLRQTLDRMGMKIEHERGDLVPFDPDTMDGPMDRVPQRGDMVRVTRSGISYRDQDGSVHPVVRTRVRRDTEGGGNPLGSPPPAESRRRSPRMRPLEGPAGTSGDRIRREPAAPRSAAERGVLTGHQGTADLGTVGGDRNTGPEGVPIRDFQLRALDPDSNPDSGYKISHGTYFRTKGVPYLVEHEDSPEGREHAKRVHRALEAHRESLPASVRHKQTGYAWVDGANPEDDQFAIEQGRAPGEFISLASSDTHGGTYLFNRETYGANGLNATLNHEFAHTLDDSELLSGRSSKSARWQEAAINDAKVRGGFRGFTSSGRQSPVRTKRKARGGGSTFPEGVTDYGTANVDEDYAESFRLYRTGPIGTVPTRDGGTELVYFRDLFPERAAILDEIMPDFAREQKAEIAEMRRTGEVPFMSQGEERLARAIRDVSERRSAGTPRMRPMRATLPERAEVGPDGILRGRVSQEREISDLLSGPDRPDGIPVRDLTLGRHSNYTMKSGRLYRFNGVNYLVEHDNDEGGGASLQAQRRVLDRVRIEHEQLPPELRQHVKSYTTLLRPDPFDEKLLRETGEVFETGAQAKRNDVTIFGMGLNDDGWRAHRIRHVIPHESGHTADYSFDWISGKPEWQTQARVRPNRVYDFVQNDSKDISHVRLEPAFGQPFPWGVTNYGLSNVEEDFAESLRLYLFGIIGRGAPTQGGQSIDVWFRDVYPERAAVLDRLFPDFARRQAEQIARARGY